MFHGQYGSNLGFGYQAPRPHPVAMASAGNVTGAGDLRFTASHAPAGVGRLQLVPFQIDANTALTASAWGAGARFLPMLFGETATQATMQTPQISWAVFRLVGLVTAITRQLAVTDIIEIRQLNVGGGANLLQVTQGSRAELYDIASDRIPGLREYPLVRSPNQVELTVGFRDGLGGATLLGQNVLEVGVLADNLADDVFGAHLPGPYARQDAMIRKAIGRY